MFSHRRKRPNVSLNQALAAEGERQAAHFPSNTEVPRQYRFSGNYLEMRKTRHSPQRSHFLCHRTVSLPRLCAAMKPPPKNHSEEGFKGARSRVWVKLPGHVLSPEGSLPQKWLCLLQQSFNQWQKLFNFHQFQAKYSMQVFEVLGIPSLLHHVASSPPPRLWNHVSSLRKALASIKRFCSESP